MAINVNYLSLRDQGITQIGEIELFDFYKSSSPDFPYLYLHQKNINIFKANWPYLVPYLYDQKIEIINDLKVKINSFQVLSFSNNAGVLTLRFNSNNALTVINGLIEDRRMHFLENNNNNSNWNKTFTPLNDIAFNGNIILLKNNNYYINTVDIQDGFGIITTLVPLQTVIPVTNLNNTEIEFGLFRIPNSNENVYFPGIGGSYFCNNNNSFLKGLKIRSQMLSHSHDHAHGLSNHTHTMSHTHNMNHTHGMNHTHLHLDTYNTMNSVLTGWNNPYAFNTSNDAIDVLRTSDFSNKQFSDVPNINITSESNNLVSNSISNNSTTSILEENMLDYENELSNSRNFIKKTKISPETYGIYAYVYGGKFNL